ncbi:MAG: hypothetical protein M1823_003674 [Watsoniomyces obsoletus]|nr:MAG: hypothetical protein M1823_003674 [Watsoniomyces obsoletus]
MVFGLLVFLSGWIYAIAHAHAVHNIGGGWTPLYAIRNRATIQRIYDNVVYPNQIPVIQNGGKAVPKGLFDPNARGRISPVGNFTGFEDTIEYFFGLSPIPRAPRYIALNRAELVSFQTACPEVASSVVYLHSAELNPNSTEPPREVSILKQVAFWRFDSAGAVISYEAWIPNLQSWINLVNGVPTSNPDVQAATINATCNQVQQVCTGNDTQYESVDACVTDYSRKTYGTYDEAWGNNVVCRTIHVVLSGIRPDVHCSHVGPTGGGKCVDISYNQKYFDDEMLFQRPLGTTFKCDP